MTTKMQKKDERLMRPGDDQPIADEGKVGDKSAASEGKQQEKQLEDALNEAGVDPV
jgi:hypothetical protein